MDKSIKDIERELALLDKQKTELENKLIEVIESAMLRVAKAQKINRISEHIFVVRLSDIIGNPWSSHFFDWNKSVSIVKKFLRAKPVLQWKDSLQRKLDDTQEGKPVIFIFSSGSGWSKTTERIPVSYEFIKEIIKQLEK